MNPSKTLANLAAALCLIASSFPQARAQEKDDDKARAVASRSLREIGLAMHNYHAMNNCFPPAFVQSEDGKPLLSWRVLILPLLGHEQLYKEFHLNESWDSPHNKPLLAKMPKTYAPGASAKAADSTLFKIFVGSGALFEAGGTAASLADVTDGTSNTLMAVQSSDPVPWTKPEEISFDPAKPLPKLAGPLKGGVLALLADGSTRFISDRAKPELVKCAVTRAGGEVMRLSDLDPKPE